MKLLYIALIILLFRVTFVYSAEPIIALQAKVTRTIAGPELWLEYTKTFYTLLALKSQYESYGYRYNELIPGLPNTIAGFAQLRQDDYTNLHEQTARLQGLVLQLDDDPRQLSIEQQRITIQEYKRKIAQLEIELFALQQQADLNDMYEEKILEIINSISEEKQRLADEKLRLYSQAVYDFYRNSFPVVSVSASGNKFNFRSEFIETDISLGGIAILNPGPVLGFSNYFDVWLEYIAPQIKLTNTGQEYRTDFFSTGINLNIPITDLLKISNFTSNIKFGGGFYWAKTRMPNIVNTSSNWNGEMLRLELNLSNFTRNFPLEAYGGVNFMNHPNNVNFITDTGIIELGNNFWTTNLHFGLRFTLLRTPVVYP